MTYSMALRCGSIYFAITRPIDDEKFVLISDRDEQEIAKLTAAPWQEALDDLFSSAINQEPLDEALNQVAELTVIDPSYHEEVIGALDFAIGLAEQVSVEMLPAINKSGYGASDAKSAHFLLCYVKKIYLEELLKVRKLRGA